MSTATYIIGLVAMLIQRRKFWTTQVSSGSLSDVPESCCCSFCTVLWLGPCSHGQIAEILDSKVAKGAYRCSKLPIFLLSLILRSFWLQLRYILQLLLFEYVLYVDIRHIDQQKNQLGFKSPVYSRPRYSCDNLYLVVSMLALLLRPCCCLGQSGKWHL